MSVPAEKVCTQRRSGAGGSRSMKRTEARGELVAGAADEEVAGDKGDLGAGRVRQRAFGRHRHEFGFRRCRMDGNSVPLRRGVGE